MKLATSITFVLLGTVALALGPVMMRSTKLNGPLGTVTTTGDVDEFALSPDGTCVVYLADQDVQNVHELYSARRDGTGSPTRLTDILGTGGAIDSFAITPDSSRVVYRADQDTAGLEEIYSVPIDGGAAAVKLNGTIVAGGSLYDYGYHFTSDGQTLVYIGDQDVDGEQFVYQVPTDGSAAAQSIAAPTVSGGDASFPRITPDDSMVVFTGTLETLGVIELYRVPIDGSASPTKLSPPLTNGDIGSFDVSPDGTWVVYVSTDNLLLQRNVFSVPLDLSAAPVILNAPLAFGTSDVDGFWIDPTSMRVIYQADGDRRDVEELYTAPIDGGSAAVKLSETLTSGSASLTYPPEASFSPEGSTVIYHARPGGSYNQLYSAPTDGSAAANLLTLPAGSVRRARLTPDSTCVVFTGRQPYSTTEKLYLVPADGSAAATQLSAAVPEQSWVEEFQVTSDSATVVYTAGPNSDLTPSAFAVPVDNSSAPTTVFAGSPWSRIRSLVVDTASSTAVLYGDSQSVEVEELFVSPLDGGAARTKLNGALVSVPGQGQVGSFVVSPDGRWVVYADGNGFHSADLKSGGSPVLLSPAGLENGAYLDQTVFSHDSARVFFTLNAGDAANLLYSAPVDGSEPPTLLHVISAGLNNRFHSLKLSDDGSHLVHSFFFWDYFGPPNSTSIYTVPADGSGPPVRLGSDELAGNALLTPDASRVVFFLESYYYGTYARLKSAPMDGSSPAVNLFTPVPLHYDGLGQLADGGTRVVYRTWNESTNVRELYSVPVDASAAPTFLDTGFPVSGSSSTLAVVGPVDTHLAYVKKTGSAYELRYGPADGSSASTLLASYPLTVRIDDLIFSPDGSRVVFLADAETDGQFELFSAPVDASAAPVRVNDDLVPMGDVLFDENGRRQFQITRNGATVVYRADARIDTRNELFAAPIGGGGPATMLHNPLGPGLEIYGDFQLLQDSEHVLYRGNPNPNLLPVWLTRLDGTGGYKMRSGPFDHSTFVEEGFLPTSNDLRVIYRAPQDTEGVIELYSFPLKAGPRRPDKLPKAVGHSAH